MAMTSETRCAPTMFANEMPCVATFLAAMATNEMRCAATTYAPAQISKGGVGKLLTPCQEFIFSRQQTLLQSSKSVATQRVSHTRRTLRGKRIALHIKGFRAHV